MNKDSQTRTLQIFSIPAGISFADSLAKGLLQEVGENREKLASYLILLPTRRACRTLQEAFLRQAEGTPMLLPRMQPFGDIDAEELFISVQGQDEIDIPPAISPLRRQILLAKTISKLPDFSKGPVQDMDLAKALGSLMDQIYTEGLDINCLPNIVDREAFAAHWQITINFLNILSEHWPKILAERGVIDPADRRNRLIKALNAHWQKNPPAYPVIAAGSTGSIPATSALLKTISALPNGSVILPALDLDMPKDHWNAVTEGHPQATLKKLLDDFGCSREDVKNWKYITEYAYEKKCRETLASKIMAPPEKTDSWQNIILSSEEKKGYEETLKKVRRYDCTTPQEEAKLIALLLRETLEEPTKTAALITPDRNLARRVTMICRRWQIKIDDSAGQTLADNSMGSYLRCCAQAALENAKPLSLLAFLKHDYCKGAGFKNFRSATRALDYHIMRGTTPAAGFDGLRTRYAEKLNKDKIKHKPPSEILELTNHLDSLMDPLTRKLSDGFHSFSDILDLHIALAEEFASDDDTLWQGEEGEAAASFLYELRDHAENLPQVSGADYLAILSQFMKGVTIRPRYGTHPRLMILGQLEARLVKADRIILSGLNEGTWPPDVGHDPWMSRPMRQNFGLPSPERSITLAAHDFVQGFCGEQVFLTRSTRVDGTPTVPARWLQRLDTFLQAIEIDPTILQDSPHKKYLAYLDQITETKPIERPEPRPPIFARPTELSVTKIETWMQDPYAIYAGQILKLKKLDQLEKTADTAERGTMLHAIMEKFTEEYPKDVPDDASNNFMVIAKNILSENTTDPTEWNFWLPRMMRLGEWIVSHEQKWRKNARFIKAEAKGSMTFSDGLEMPFILNARADRIDILGNSHIAIIDYKSGGQYSKAKMESGALPQLPLEALMVTEGGFAKAGISAKSVGAISYWKLTGAREAGEIITLDDPQKLEQSITNAKTGLLNLVIKFSDINTPYYAIPKLDNAPRYNDYEHLERVKEWAALDDNPEEVA